MKLVTFLFKYSKGLAILAIISGLIGGLANIGVIAMINASLASRGDTRTLVWIFVGLGVTLVVTRIISSLVLTQLAQNATLDLRMQMSRQILGAPLRDLEEIGPHRLLATLAGDTASITSGVLIIPNLCLQGALLVGSLIYLAWLSGLVFVGTLIFIVVGVGTYQLAINYASKYLRRARENQDKLFNHFRSMTEGTKELKLHRRRRHKFVSDVLYNTSHDLRRSNIKGNVIFTAASSWGQMLFFALIGLLVFGLPALQRVDAQTLIGYTFTLLYIVVPIEVISQMIPSLSASNVALQKVESLGLTLSAKPNDEVQTTDTEASVSWQSLELHDVTHTYHRERENSTFTLGPINIDFTHGSLVFIVGGNGSGKTTFAKLLTGLYIPETGHISLDGVAITDENREFYRQHFSVVHSNFHLFESLLGLEAPSLDERAKEYLELLQLDHKVEIKDGVLSTTSLSQGQRKRLALLTAYLEDRSIYLFDEWAADQDPLFKEIFYLELLPQLKRRGKTVFVISHDDHYYHLADRIIKLDEGRLEFDRPALTAVQEEPVLV